MGREYRGFTGTKRYRPVRLLGAGGMGAVYEVEDRATGAHVALKVMLTDDATRLLRFKQEFRSIAELHHPNLVRVFDLTQHEGQWFFTMELVHGQDLLDVLLDGASGDASSITETRAAALDATSLALAPPITESAEPTHAERRHVACDVGTFAPVITQILDALAYLHSRGIVHRDLKPSNILVDLEGVVRVLDFGLASRVDRAFAISHEGAIVGTLAYLSPEQLRGEAASFASDLYALGCLMFQILTGELPLAGRGMEALTARCEAAPVRVDARVTGVPKAIVDIVERLMAREATARPAIAEVRAALGMKPSPVAREPASHDGLDTSEGLFVGRQRELSILAGCLERALRGQAQLALVEGPSGIGKSALSAMMIRSAERRSVLCFQGRCYEREQVPFVAFDRLMDQLVLALRDGPPERLATLATSLAALAQIFPAFGLLVRDGEARDLEADPRERYHAAVEGFRHVCAVLQAGAPLCFVLDDLQWADEESVDLLSALIAENPGRMLVIGLFHPGVTREGHPLARFLRAVDGDARATRITLAALDGAEAVRLVEAVTGSSFEAATSEALARQTGGNPFLVRRVSDHLRALDPAARVAWIDALGSSSDVLHDMIRALSPRAEQVLALAATAGGDVASSLLRETLAEGGTDFDLAVGELAAARLIKAVPRGVDADDPHLDVYHDRIRQGVYQGLPEARRRALHLALARAIEARPTRDVEALMRHYGHAGEVAKHRRYALEAAARAASMLAFVHAARLFRAALDTPDPEEPSRLTADRWEEVGTLFEYGGQHLPAARAYERALDHWDGAAASEPDRAAARLRLRGLVGANLMATDRVLEGRAVFEAGLALLGLPLSRATGPRLAILAALSTQNAVVERLPAVRAILRPGPLAATEVRFLDAMVRAFQPLWPAPAAEAAQRAELLARRIDDKLVELRSLAFGALVPLFLGRCSPRDIERAHARLDAADAIARAHEVALGREIVQINRSFLWLATDTARARRLCETALQGFARRGMLESFDGNVARAFSLYILMVEGDEEALFAAIARELGFPQPNFINVAIGLCLKTGVLARRGRRAEAAETRRLAEEHLAGLPPSRLDVLLVWARAITQIAERRFDDVLARIERVEREWRATGAWGIALDRCVWMEVELSAAIGARLPARIRRRVRASATWLIERGVFDFKCLGHRALAALHHAEGREAEARVQMRRAIAASSTNATPHHRWLCLTTARDLGLATLDEEAEAAEIEAQRGYVR